MADPVLSVIVPAFNERESIEAILDAVGRVPIAKEIVVVDDGSTDGTREVLRDRARRHASNVITVHHDVNRGKGTSVRSGIEKVRGELVVIQDADLEYDPADYAMLLHVFEDPKIQVVYGSRFLSGQRVTHPLHRLANRIITDFGNLLFGSRLTDLETCYKMFRREILKSLDLSARGFEIEVEMTAKVLKKGISIVEVPISYRGRNYAQGKKITWFDGFYALWMLLRLRFFA